MSESDDLKKELVLHVRKEIGPIGSPTLATLLPEPLSSASIRNTLAELTLV